MSLPLDDSVFARQIESPFVLGRLDPFKLLPVWLFRISSIAS